MAKRKRLSPATTLVAEDNAAPRSWRAPIADVAADASAQAALGELSETLARARAEGRMVIALPLEEIRLDHLVRDRVAVAGDEMQSLMDSLKARGQQTPVEVEALEGGGYGLISGWRRCQALRQLQVETGEARFGEVLALLRQPGEASQAYLAMVEENEIRVGLSYFERARIVAKSVERGVFATEKIALRALFGAASPAKRSKIGSFLSIVAALDGHLRFPEALAERQGLALSHALADDPALAGWLQTALAAATPDTAEAERAVLERRPVPATPVRLGSAPHPALDKGASGPDKTGLTGQTKTQEHQVRLRRDGSGRIILEGAGLTKAFETRLRNWLAQEGEC